MRSIYRKNLIFFCIGSLLMNVSIAQQTNSKPTIEGLVIKAEETKSLIGFSKLANQSSTNLGTDEASGRGGLTALLVSKVVKGIQQMIDNREKKYTTQYGFAIKNEHFYNDISTVGAFDPTGIRFKGFTIVRFLTDESGAQTDTAVIAKFGVDADPAQSLEILNNSIFHLHLESLQLKSPKVKVTDIDPKLNMDFEINLSASYLTRGGEMRADAAIGKFICTIRDAPLDPKTVGYKEYYEKLRNKPCIGQSFLVPRSSGYYKKADGFDECYGVGFYTLKVAVTESSRNTFVDKLIDFSVDDAMILGKEALQKKIH